MPITARCSATSPISTTSSSRSGGFASCQLGLTRRGHLCRRTRPPARRHDGLQHRPRRGDSVNALVDLLEELTGRVARRVYVPEARGDVPSPTLTRRTWPTPSALCLRLPSVTASRGLWRGTASCRPQYQFVTLVSSMHRLLGDLVSVAADRDAERAAVVDSDSVVKYVELEALQPAGPPPRKRVCASAGCQTRALGPSPRTVNGTPARPTTSSAASTPCRAAGGDPSPRIAATTADYGARTYSSLTL